MQSRIAAPFIVATLALGWTGLPAQGQVKDGKSKPRIEAPLLDYFKAQAVPHERAHRALLDRFNSLRANRDFLPAADVLQELRKESEFTPAHPPLLDGLDLDIGKIGALGKVKIFDVLDRNAALVVASGPHQKQGVLVRNLDGQILCNECWITLDTVRITASEPYKKVLKERQIERQGQRRDQYSESSEETGHDESSEEMSGTGSTSSGELTEEEDVESSTETSEDHRSDRTKKSDRTHSFQESDFLKVLGQKETVLVVEPIGRPDEDTGAISYWDKYRADERKRIDKAESEFFGEMVRVDVGIKDGQCRLVAHNDTKLLLEDVVVRILGKPGKIKPIDVKFKEIKPGNKRSADRQPWSDPKAEPSAKVVALRLAPPPRCAKCNGTGKATCLICLGQKVVTCKTCKGTGEITKRTYVNNGDYKEPRSYTERCNKCKSVGNTPCRACKETGEVRCPKCKGA